MTKKLVVACAMLAGTIVVAGCSGSSAAMESLRIGKNVSKKDSHLKIYLDGQEAKQNTLKKAYMGHASFKVSSPVSTTPTFRFEFTDPEKFGRITGTNMQIHQEFEADYSHQAEYTIYPAGSDAASLMKPGETYNLGAVGPNLRVLDFEKKQVGGVQLKPGVEYLLVFTVSGDRSESVQVLFETK